MVRSLRRNSQDTFIFVNQEVTIRKTDSRFGKDNYFPLSTFMFCGSRNIPGARVRPCGGVLKYSGFPNVIVLLADKFGICRACVVLRLWAYPRDIN